MIFFVILKLSSGTDHTVPNRWQQILCSVRCQIAIQPYPFWDLGAPHVPFNGVEKIDLENFDSLNQVHSEASPVILTISIFVDMIRTSIPVKMEFGYGRTMVDSTCKTARRLKVLIYVFMNITAYRLISFSKTAVWKQIKITSTRCNSY